MPLKMAWIDVQPFLELRGYHLRPRFHPDWALSWLWSGMTAGRAFLDEIEDSIFIVVQAFASCFWLQLMLISVFC